MNIEFLLANGSTDADEKWMHQNARDIEHFYWEITCENIDSIDYKVYKEHTHMSPRLIKRLVCEQKDVPFVFKCGNCKCDLRTSNYHPWEEADESGYDFVCDDCHLLYRLAYSNDDDTDDDDTDDDNTDDEKNEYNFAETCKRVVCSDECIICREQKTLYSFFPKCTHTTCFDCFLQMTPMRCVYKCK